LENTEKISLRAQADGKPNVDLVKFAYEYDSSG
jgi:hypothetical protein